MENGMTEIKPSNAPVREIGVITAEIKDLCRQAQTMALLYAVEIGRRLAEAKSMLAYGKWGEWLKNEVEFSQSTANNFMRLFEEYGASQISIFGASVDSQTIANLPYSKALQLLAIPKEEREKFAEEVGADELSVKELRAAIEERDRARREAEEAKTREAEISEKLRAAEEAAGDAYVKAEEVKNLKTRLDNMVLDLERSKKNADDLRKKLSEAEKNPKISKSELDKIRKEAAEAAKKESRAAKDAELEKMQKRADDAEAEAIKAKLAAQEAERALEEARKAIKTANPQITAFKTLFDSMQDTAGKLKSMITNIHQSDPETADKLCAALRAFGEGLSNAAG